jgi:rhodanese-related sulfurtransferase
MPEEIRRAKVIELLEGGAQLLDVLSKKQYEEVHLAGAVSIPLGELDQERVASLNRERPVISYCYDFQ